MHRFMALTTNHNNSQTANIFKIVMSFVFKFRNDLRATSRDVSSKTLRKKDFKWFWTSLTTTLASLGEQLKVVEFTIKYMVHGNNRFQVNNEKREVHIQQDQGELYNLIKAKAQAPQRVWHTLIFFRWEHWLRPEVELDEHVAVTNLRGTQNNAHQVHIVFDDPERCKQWGPCHVTPLLSIVPKGQYYCLHIVRQFRNNWTCFSLSETFISKNKIYIMKNKTT